MSMPYYDLLEDILVPPHRGKPEIADVLLERAMNAYQCNKPQAGAIVSALFSTGFSLIQGYVSELRLTSLIGSNRCHLDLLEPGRPRRFLA